MHNKEYPTREFGQAGLRFCREAKGILWGSHKNVEATGMETHRGPGAGEDNTRLMGEDLQTVMDAEDQPSREKGPRKKGEF